MMVPDQTENLSKRYIEVPIDMSASILCSLSYVTLFTYIVRMGRNSPGDVKKREIRLCVQFVIIFLTYTVTWSSFFIFPMFGITVAEAYITTSVVFMANCGVNAIILLLLNKEIQREFYKLFGMNNKMTAVVHSSLTVPVASRTNEI